MVVRAGGNGGRVGWSLFRYCCSVLRSSFSLRFPVGALDSINLIVDF